MIPSFIDKTKLPHRPGVYIFKDQQGSILYVGKAIDLYHRVASYFNHNYNSSKTTALVEKIGNFETIEVLSELESLILEANLIKKYLPPFNIKLTDDKSYLYIKVTKSFFPKIVTARKQQLSDAKIFFGPFPSSTVVKSTLKKLRKVFPWCSNPPVEGKVIKPCFYYHLGLCPGPCNSQISRKDYLKTINQFIKFMEGKKDQILTDLQKDMEIQSSNQQYEQASRTYKMINSLEYLLQSNNISVYLENPNYLEDLNKQALEQLQNDLHLTKIPGRIECYDISHTSGNQTVGSLVVLTYGEVDKKWYRRFKVDLEGKPNDFASMEEVISRRLKHLEWPFPDVMLIDGGIGQVRAAYKQLLKNNFNFPLYGLAKRREWLYSPDGKALKLPRSSLSLKLLQKIRDEAHRFAITYHRKLRDQKFKS